MWENTTPSTELPRDFFCRDRPAAARRCACFIYFHNTPLERQATCEMRATNSQSVTGTVTLTQTQGHYINIHVDISGLSGATEGHLHSLHIHQVGHENFFNFFYISHKNTKVVKSYPPCMFNVITT